MGTVESDGAGRKHIMIKILGEEPGLMTGVFLQIRRAIMSTC